ncbi:MAG: DMT family transporter [Alphaproteobacteria bacterium]|nr:DMT family transporter [Alphaproteobacteria bacterium]
MSARFIEAARHSWDDLPENIRGAIWILIAAGLLTTMSALIKHLGKDIPAVQLVFFRSVIGTILVVPIIIRTGFSVFHTKRPLMHLARVSAGTLGMFCVFYAFTHLPLAETMAIVFSRPLFAVWLAAIFLGEIVGARRITAALAGFAGVLIMVRPGSATFDPASLYALTAAISAGCIAVVIKKMSATESTMTMVLWFSVGSAVITLIPSIYVWVPPHGSQWVYLVLIGGIGVIGQAALTKGFSTGDTSFVTPFDYSRLIYATVIGFFFFTEIPDMWSVLGALIIVSSGTYIARRELSLIRARAKETPSAAAPPKDAPRDEAK